MPVYGGATAMVDLEIVEHIKDIHYLLVEKIFLIDLTFFTIGN